MKKRNRFYVQIGNIGCTVLFMLLFTGGAFAQQRQFNWWGELGYDFLSHQFESSDDRIEHTALVRLNGAGYLHEPWLATLEGGIGMFLRRADTDSGDSSSDNIIGNAILRMFPQSRFPLQLFAEKTDSRSDTSLTGLEIDRTRYGISQSYTTKGGGVMGLGYEHSDTTNITTSVAEGEKLREDVSDLFKATFNQAFGAHSISFDANANNVDITNSVDYTNTAFATLRHGYTPSPTFSAEDMLTFNKNETATEFNLFDSEVWQLNSFGFWRPRTRKPLRINGTIRALTRTNKTLAAETESQTATGTLGANYEWSERWVFNANAGVTGAEVEDDKSTTHFQALNALFTSRTYKPFNIDAGWFGQLDLRNTDDDDESVQEAGAQIGYNLDKSIAGENRHFYALRLSQSINSLADTNDFSSNTLFTTASASWNRRGVRSNGMARFAMSDNRTYASGPNSDNLEGEFNLQASFDTRISATSLFRANATLQVSRNYRPEIPGLIEGSNGDWIPTSTVDFTYNKLGVFSVPQLSFYSTFRHVSNSYAPLVGDPVGDRVTRDDNQWENRLEYTVGRLQLRAISRLSDIQGQKQNYFLFQVRRMIGDL
jgi:hypothetical protein